jgi:hypothetical protein
LQGDGRKFLEPVQAAGGVGVAQRDGEDQSPGQRRQPSQQAPLALGRPSTDGVIAMIDGLEERLQVGLDPRLLSGRDQDQRETGAGQGALKSALETVPLDRHDTGLDRPTH